MLNILTNSASMTASRALQRNQRALAQSFQRLSTGLRINGAKDDAAGLAIANNLTAQYRGLNQAARNANDSISMLQTAESAIAEQQNMVQRLRELAVQAASDNVTATDRTAIQAEADALMSEIDRVATQTTYNGRDLLDGSFSSVQFQVGAFENESISVTLKSTRNFNVGATVTYTSAAVTANGLAADDLVIEGVAIDATEASDDGVSSTGNIASAIAKAAVINEKSAQTGVTATANATELTGGAITAGAVSGLTINGVTVADFTSTVADANSAMRNAINAVSSESGVTASLDGTDVVLTAEDGRNITIGGTVDNTGLTAATTYSTLTLESEDAFTVTDGGSGALATNSGITAASYNTLSATNVSNLNLASQSGATTAMGVLDDAIAQLNKRQATIGALVNRMTNAVSSLSAAAENVAAARGRIQDADFAAETAAFSKNQILVQASTSMLAQANVSKQLALQLLG